MSGVLAGMSVVWVIILLGWVLGRARILGDGAQDVLNRLVYWVATPALLFATLATTEIRALVGAPLAIAALSAIAAAGTFALVSRFVLRDSRGETVVGAMASSLANAAHLGIPLAAYVLGSATHVVPVLLFQLGFFTPMFFVLADLVSQDGRTSPRRVVRVVVSNPLVVASAVGMLLGATGTAVPDLVMEPIRVVGGAAVPAVLIAFGLSMAEAAPTGRPVAAAAPDDAAQRRRRRTGADVALATTLKLAVQPAFAFLLGSLAFGLTGHALFAVVAMAGLPAAQNTYVAAFRTGTAITLARGAVLATTLLAIPSLATIAALLA